MSDHKSKQYYTSSTAPTGIDSKQTKSEGILFSKKIEVITTGSLATNDRVYLTDVAAGTIFVPSLTKIQTEAQGTAAIYNLMDSEGNSYVTNVNCTTAYRGDISGSFTSATYSDIVITGSSATLFLSASSVNTPTAGAKMTLDLVFKK
jgi:hypothetical protein